MNPVFMLLIGSGAGLIVGLLFPRRANGQLAKANEEIVRYKGRLQGRAEAEAEYKIKITPCHRETKVGAIVLRRRMIEIGYDYQLFIRGIPSLKSMETIVRREQMVEVDPEALVELASSSTEAAAQEVFGGLATVLKPVPKTAIEAVRRRLK